MNYLIYLIFLIIITLLCYWYYYIKKFDRLKKRYLKNLNDKNIKEILTYPYPHHLFKNLRNKTHENALQIATKYLRRTEMIKKLVNLGYDINIVDRYRDTLLIYAIKQNLSDVVETLINLGINLNIKNKRKETAFQLAIKFDRTDYVKKMIHLNIKLHTGNSCEPILAILNKNKQIIKLLLQIDNNITKLWRKQINIIIEAVKKDFKIFKLLFEHGFDITAKSKSKRSILTLIIRERGIPNIHKVIKYLLNNGIKISDEYYYNLKLSIRNGRKEILKEFINFQPKLINYQGGKGNSLLMESIFYNRDNISKYLMNKDIDINSQNNEKKTALFIAVINNNVNIVKLLLQRAHTNLPNFTYCNPNIKNNKGRTAIFYGGNISIVRTLIKYGADINIKDNKGLNFIQHKPPSMRSKIRKDVKEEYLSSLLFLCVRKIRANNYFSINKLKNLSRDLRCFFIKKID